ncbi:magnesium transporter [Globomyces pollinis-pini]|nr:magnesium transporter [Globomyces pollinis-pini]
MAFLYGLLTAIAGNIGIGVGQVIQKHAINRLEVSNYTEVNLDDKEYLSESNQTKNRLFDKEWIFGLVINYMGEMCNWVALSLTSPAVVTPLGIISVLLNVVLASIFLGEPITINQKRGYCIVLLGIIGILYVAPKGDANLGTTVSQVISSVHNPLFLCGFLSLFLIQSFLIYITRFVDKNKLFLYVAICAMFGAISVASGKLVSTLLLVYNTSDALSTLHIGKNQPRTSNFTLMVIYISIFLSIIILSTIFQEFFKQKSLSIFHVSRFVPVLYAGFNGCVVLTSVCLFPEFKTVIGTLVFLITFTAFMILIVFGISIVQTDEPIKSLMEMTDA